MTSTTFTVRSSRVVLPDHVGAAAIHVRDGRIAAVAGYHDTVAGVPTLDAGELVVMPGLVDTHVHVNDPGRTDWEGFEHATRAAAAGGITTIVDMPLNSIPSTTTGAALDAKLRAAHGRCYVDVGFWGGVVPGNTGELERLVRAGVLGFKAFLSPSGVEEFCHVSESDLREALPVVAELAVPLLVHAELPSQLRDPEPGRDPCDYDTWLGMRPPAAECAAIDLLIRLAQKSGVRVHVVHLATAEALPALSAARSAGVPVSVETCPHYLTFAADEIPRGETSFKCAPPIRSREDREHLWKALEDGRIDLVASDHSPSPPALKRPDTGDFVAAWGGIASLQLALAIVWTGASARGLSIERLTGWMAAAPARLAGLERRKGAIATGRDADFVLWDPDAEWTVDAAALHHRHAVTPYAGRRLRGAVHATLVRGEVVFREGRFPGSPRGAPLLGNSL